MVEVEAEVVVVGYRPLGVETQVVSWHSEGVEQALCAGGLE